MLKVKIQNNSRIELLKSHLKTIEKAAKKKAINHSSAFEVEVALNKSTSAFFNLHRSNTHINVVVTNVVKK